MNSIYRLRPFNERTIDELKNSYLWFSRPTQYNDIADSNIIAFVEKNESIKDSFDRIFYDYKEIGKQASYTGICCFTETLPKKKEWKHFPKGSNGIFVEYDRDVLQKHFQETMGIGDCFNKVEYLANPIVFDAYSKYDIAWETTENGTCYKALRYIEKDPKSMDKLFLKMFTRLSDKHIKQNELRIILGGRNVPDKSDNLKGYMVKIPRNAIRRIIVGPKLYEKVRNEFSEFIVEKE